MEFYYQKIIVIVFFSFAINSNAQRPGDTGSQADNAFWEGFSQIITNTDSAQKILEKCLNTYTEENNCNRIHFCLQGIAACFKIKKDFSNEELSLKRAIKNAYSCRNTLPSNYVASLINLSNFYIRYGGFDKAVFYGQNGLSFYKKNLPNKDTISYFQLSFGLLNSLGVAESKRGNHIKSVDYHLLANEFVVKGYIGDFSKLLYNINNTGAAFMYFENFEKAKSYFYKAISLINKEKIKPSRATYNPYHSLALIYLSSENTDSAKNVLDIIHQLPKNNSGYRLRIIHQISGEYYLQLDSLHEAAIEFKAALELRKSKFTKFQNINFLIQAYHQLASTYLLLNHPDSALATYQGALNKLTISHNDITTPYPLLAVPILDGKAQAHLGRYHQSHNQTDLDTALWCYLTADTLVDQARDRLQNEGSKLFFSQKSRPIYERAIRFCLMMHELTSEQQYLEKAFYFSERNKATLLFQSLQDAGAKLAAGLPDSLLERERNLKVDIAFYQNKIFEAEQKQSAKDSARLIEWRQILFDREEAYRSLNKELEEQYAEYYHLKYDHTIMTVEEVQQKLNSSQMMLEFFEGDSAVYVFAIDGEGIQVHEVVRDSLLDERIQGLLTSLQHPQTGLEGLKSFAQPAHTLFTQLLEPVLTDRKINHLIIIPDGQLSYLPFELLLHSKTDITNLDDRQADRKYRHLLYLFQEMETRYAYSATLLFANPYRPKARRNEVAAYAPAYTGSWFLANNQPQAVAIADMMGGKAFTGTQADKQTFLQTAPDFRVLHLAMHGEPDLYSPLRARLLFAGEDTVKANSLYAYELYNLKLNAQMAVLAACESGYGKLEQSEGIYSLARAFRFAGCPSVVSSLWKADGQATIELMKAFYGELEEGASKSEALQAARKTYLETAPNSQLHPYYWANFVVIGDDEAISNGGNMWWLVIGLLLIGGLLLTRFTKLRKVSKPR